MLVIGAGTGNDVGVALSEGARHVDAVEIDPDLVGSGREYNPEHAYQSPRVSDPHRRRTVVPPGHEQRYSLILYALPDSSTALTGQSAPVGLENYLLTTQAIQVAADPPGPGRDLRDVQLLPTVPARPVCDRHSTGVRLAPVCRAGKHPERRDNRPC